MSEELTHLGPDGAARMVDVGAKPATRRVAIAGAQLTMAAETLEKILAGGVAKGEVLQVARVAGVMAGKRTGELIPLCHPLGLDVLRVTFQARGPTRLDIFAEARVTGRTGIEMEALTAASVAGLTVYDMCKAVDRGMVLGGVRLLFKAGGKHLVCELAGELTASEGTPGADGVVALREAGAPGTGTSPYLELAGIPLGLLPDDLWLVFEGGARGRLVEGPALLLEGAPPEPGAKVRVRTGESYG